MTVFIVLCKWNDGEGTSTFVEEVFQNERNAQRFIEERNSELDECTWYEILQKEVN